jgi:hypothetical protein
LYKPKDNSVEELELKDKLESALQDLPKLLRRKEEALELFVTTKNPEAFNNFFKTERLQELIGKLRDEAAEKIADSQNAEHAEAEDLINNGKDPIEVSKKTGAELTTIQKILDNKNKIKQAKKAESIKKLLSALNSDLSIDNQFQNVDELVEELSSIIDDEESSDEQVDAANALIEQINYLLSDAEKPEVKTPDAEPSKDGLIDIDDIKQPSDESDINENANEVDKSNKSLNADDKLTQSDGDSEMLVDAFNHIA